MPNTPLLGAGSFIAPQESADAQQRVPPSHLLDDIDPEEIQPLAQGTGREVAKNKP